MASTGAQPRRGDGEATTANHHCRHRHRFVSDDLNFRVQGKILEQKEPGRIDGIRLELDLPDEDEGDAAGGDDANEREDAITVLYPQLVSVHTKPESQTLVSINTGERLLTLETPLISDQDSDQDRDDGDDNAVDDDDDDVSDIEGGDERTEKRKQPPPEAKGNKKKRRPVVITLHEGFLPASEATQLEESSLYSTTFRIVIDGPSYPLPHFDPAVLAPPTPAVRPHGGAGAGMSDSNSAYGGVLNSPTLQRALLSPLLSPQRRAASQGSDMSVPPLSLGLSRASRPSFSAAERPHIDNSVAGQKRPPAPVTLLTLIPSLAPPKPSAFPTSSTTPQVGPSSVHQQQHQHNGHTHTRQTLPPAPTLAGTLTSALSSAAKHTAEEILALRRAHDAYQRRAKAELEVLEARIENARSEAGIAVAVGGTESVVRGFKTKEERAKEREERNASVSRSRERERGRDEARGRSHDRDRDASGSAERPPYASPAVRPSLGSASTSSGSIPNRDEAASALIRAQDEREEDERGRSRSRSRRAGPPNAATAAPGGMNPPGSSASRGRPEASSSASSSSTNNAPVSGSATQRSRSRTKAVAEATLRAVEAAKDRQGATASPTGAADGSPSPRMGHGQGQATLAPPPPAAATGPGQSGERRARSPLSRGSETAATSPDAAPTSPKTKPKQASTASTTAVKDSGTNASSSSPASSGSQPLPPASRSHPPGPAAAGSTTPAFAPSSHVLVAIPETDELSIPLERTHSGGLNLDVPNDPPPAVRVEQEPEEESEPPFEMDEDVELEERDSAASVRSRQQAPALESPSLEPETTTDAPLLASSPPAPSNQEPIPVSSSFRPGSYQRASALSASYNALLASAKSAPSRPVVHAVSPSVRSPHSPFSDLEQTTLSEDQLPPFSPPDVRSYMSTSVREEAQTALLAATFERAERTRRVDGDGSSRGSSSVGGGGKGSAYIGPDPRDVRRGEQKIRDVLAMDVPSHRPRGGTRQNEQQSTAGRGFDDDEEDDDDNAPSSEEDDAFEELVCPSNVDSKGVVMSEASVGPAGGSDASSMPVGSLPIALGRPSSVNAALSSWRPDPERLWAQQRRERKTSGSVAPPPPLHSPAGRLVPEEAPGGGNTSKSPQVTAGGQAILVSSSPTPQSGTHASPAHPVEIGSPTIPRPADVGGGQGGSSLARSLRAQQGVGTFVQLTSSGTTTAPAHRRSGGEGTGSAPVSNGRDPFENERRSADRGGDSDDNDSAERQDVKETDEEKEEEEDDDDDDDDEFVPPHLVKGRRDREDEEWLSRSVPQS